MRNYKVILHRTEEEISVSVPSLPGCWSAGDTEDEALANIQDAIQEHLAALEDQLDGAEGPRSGSGGIAVARLAGINHWDAVRAFEKGRP